MNPFLSAHGYDPGPTQRPATAGALSGAIATLPAIALLALFGSIEIEARILGISVAATLGAGVAAMALAGAVYGRAFGRAANDRSGGWLFGMAYGFLLWAAGAVMVLPALSGGAAPAGQAAIGIFLAFLAWGTALGGIHPSLHRRLHVRLQKDESIGPLMAAARKERGRNRRFAVTRTGRGA